MAYKILYAKGYRNIRVLDEGIPGWIERGYPTEGWLTGSGAPARMDHAGSKSHREVFER